MIGKRKRVRRAAGSRSFRSGVFLSHTIVVLTKTDFACVSCSILVFHFNFNSILPNFSVLTLIISWFIWISCFRLHSLNSAGSCFHNFGQRQGESKLLLYHKFRLFTFYFESLCTRRCAPTSSHLGPNNGVTVNSLTSKSLAPLYTTKVYLYSYFVSCFVVNILLFLCCCFCYLFHCSAGSYVSAVTRCSTDFRPFFISGFRTGTGNQQSETKDFFEFQKPNSSSVYF